MFLRSRFVPFFVAIACAGIARPLCASVGTFADGVLEYVPGAISSSSLQQSGNAAIGLPVSVDDGQTSPFTPPFHASSITIIGAGGHITLHFANPILPNGSANIGVFTNTGLVAKTVSGVVTASTASNGNAAVFSSDAAIVSVSQNDTDWIALNNGNAIDLTRPSNAFLDGTLAPGGGGVGISGGTLPANPYQPFTGTLANFAGLTYPQMLTLFNGSFGGAWIDTTASGLDQINYIRFDVPTGDRLVLDAVTASSAVPEPASLILVLSAGTCVLALRSRRFS